MKNNLPMILRSGALVGTLDALAASIQYYSKTGKSPVVVWKYVATGVYGSSALSGDNLIALQGLFFHYIIAFCWTVLFFLVYPKIKALSKNVWLTGIGCGAVVWAGMNIIIVPLSNVPARTMTWSGALTAMLILILAIGLPLSMIARRHFAKP